MTYPTFLCISGGKSGKHLQTGKEEENARNSAEISCLKSRIDSVKFTLEQIIHRQYTNKSKLGKNL